MKPIALDRSDTEHVRQVAATAYQGYQTDGRGFVSEFKDGKGSFVSWSTPDMADAIADERGDPRLTEDFPFLVGMVKNYDPETEFIFVDWSNPAPIITRVPAPGGSCKAIWEDLNPGPFQTKEAMYIKGEPK